MASSRSAAGAPDALVLVLGEEELLVDRAIAGAVRAARKLDPDVERRESPAAGLSPMEFADLVAPSLFAEPRVVIIRQAQESSKDIAAAVAQYAGDPVDGVMLVVQHSGAARNKALADGLRKAGAAVMTCNRLTRPAERIEFVRHEIRSARGTTTPEAVAALVDAVGSDLRELAAAASQLVADTGGLVDETAVRRYLHGKAETSGFAIADLAMAGDVPASLEALRWATAMGYPMVLVADALADGVRTTAKVHGARAGSSYSLANELGMPAWKIDKARGVARQWAEAGLSRAMAVVADLNGDVKGQAVDADYAVEKAILDLAAARRLK
jgi:DNA polymerase-3 subunit delta